MSGPSDSSNPGLSAKVSSVIEWTLFPLLDQVAKPSNVLLVAMFMSLLVALLLRRQWALWLATLGMVAYMGFSVVPVGEWFLIPLEDRFPRPAAPPSAIDGIVVVSPRISGEIAIARGGLQRPTPALSALVALGHRYPNARIVLTGIGESTSARTMSHTELVRQFLEKQRFDPDRVMYADDARSNHKDMLEAAMAAAAPAPGERWLLVQAAAEIPRSIGVGRRLGWELDPWPVGYLTTGERAALAPHLRPTYYLYLLDVAVREFALLSVYHANSWSSDLFPAPRR